VAPLEVKPLSLWPRERAARIDGGLRLSQSEVQSALAACFALRDPRTDSFSDIGNAILDATDNLGRQDDGLEATYKHFVGYVRAQSGLQQIAELQMHIR
jgi:hypothetical protein